MSTLEQMKDALSCTIKLIKSKEFREYSKEEQEFFQGYIKELKEEINAEYEAQAFIAQRDRENEHGIA